MSKGESQNLNQSETIAIVICLKEQEYQAKATERIQKMRRKRRLSGRGCGTVVTPSAVGQAKRGDSNMQKPSIGGHGSP